MRAENSKSVGLTFKGIGLPPVVKFRKKARLRLNNIVYIFNGSFSIVLLNKIVAAITSGISLIETILLIGLGLKALSQGTIVIPVIDKMISNYMN